MLEAVLNRHYEKGPQRKETTSKLKIRSDKCHGCILFSFSVKNEQYIS